MWYFFDFIIEKVDKLITNLEVEITNRTKKFNALVVIGILERRYFIADLGKLWSTKIWDEIRLRQQIYGKHHQKKKK